MPQHAILISDADDQETLSGKDHLTVARVGLSKAIGAPGKAGVELGLKPKQENPCMEGSRVITKALHKPQG